jgi:acyl carrier protein
MKPETRTQIKEAVNQVMRLDIDQYPKDKALNTIREWDSFNNLMLISKIQEDFGIQFTAVDIDSIQTIGALFDAIDKKLS